MAYYIGIDPGKSGGIAFANAKGTEHFAFGLRDMSPHDIFEELTEFVMFNDVRHCYLEAVHSMPKQGVVSSFSFGQIYGILIGIVTAMSIPYTFIRPQEWQKHMQCRTGGDKNVSKRRAQQLFPTLKITHQTADALLIAEYCRQTKERQTCISKKD